MSRLRISNEKLSSNVAEKQAKNGGESPGSINDQLTSIVGVAIMLSWLVKNWSVRRLIKSSRGSAS